MGNLEANCDALDEAMEYLNQAEILRRAAGDEAAELLALTYLCQAQVYLLKKEYENAFTRAAKAEALFVRTAGASSHFMA